jgi:hypothetical protein
MRMSQKRRRSTSHWPPSECFYKQMQRRGFLTLEFDTFCFA